MGGRMIVPLYLTTLQLLQNCGFNQCFYYTYGFCGLETWTGHNRDSLSLFHKVRGLTWEHTKTEGDSGAEGKNHRKPCSLACW